MSCTKSYRQLAQLLEAQTGVPAGACPLAMAITPGADRVIRQLQQAGYQAVAVGGAIRDVGRRSSDVDPWAGAGLATSATPDQVEALFGEAVYDAGGRKHGTLLVSIPGEKPLEVTTFRRDVATDGRNATVAITFSLLEDLQRRDLQACPGPGVNALAYDPVAEKLYGPGPDGDPTEALDDLVSGTVRFVGDGVQRIREDRLRALRAVRFAVKLGGDLHPTAEQAIPILDFRFWILDFFSLPIQNPQSKIQNGVLGLLPGPLSAQRVRDELMKTLALPEGGRGLRLWQRLGLMPLFLPEVAACENQAQNIHHAGVNVLEHSFRAIEAARPPAGVDPWAGAGLAALRLAMLLHDVGKPATAHWKSDDYGYSFIDHDQVGAEIAETVCRRLRQYPAVRSLPACPRRGWDG